MIDVQVRGIGLVGPGLADWSGGAVHLRDPLHWQRLPTAVPAPARLPANERRRAGTVVKFSIAVADQAVAMADADPAVLATVFASSTGDPVNCHLLCEALAQPEHLVSPTRFTNSVHNAAAGYWHIATQSMRASTSLAAYDASFGAGLLEAAVQCMQLQREVLLVACDVPYPEPLHAVRPLPDSFAVALLLAPGTASHRRTLARLVLRIAPAAAVTPCSDAGLEALRGAIPAARALPLLARLAGAPGGPVALEAVAGLTLEVQVTPARAA